MISKPPVTPSRRRSASLVRSMRSHDWRVRCRTWPASRWWRRTSNVLSCWSRPPSTSTSSSATSWTPWAVGTTWPARCARWDGFEEAERQMRAQIPAFLRLASPELLVVLAEDYGAVLAEIGEGEAAVRLLGSADAMRERNGTPRNPIQDAEIAGPYAAARAALPPPALDRDVPGGAQHDCRAGPGRLTWRALATCHGHNVVHGDHAVTTRHWSSDGACSSTHRDRMAGVDMQQTAIAPRMRALHSPRSVDGRQSCPKGSRGSPP